MKSFINCTLYQVKENEIGSACSTHGEKTNIHDGILVGKPEIKRSLRRPRRWSEDNIKMDLR
jgi:hypothetical protein